MDLTGKEKVQDMDNSSSRRRKEEGSQQQISMEQADSKTLKQGFSKVQSGVKVA
jgi:hypothetical protein